MRKITGEQMKELDRWAIEVIGIPAVCLMENAGRAASLEAINMLKRSRGRKVCVFCGSGNNGADGMVVARYLKRQDFTVTVIRAGQTAKYTPEAALQLRIIQNLGIKMIGSGDLSAEQISLLFKKSHLLIDALFGIGLSKNIEGGLAGLVLMMNASKTPILSLDIPSGLDATSGEVKGAAIKAARTVTFAVAKTGLFRRSGSINSGHIVVADIGIPLKARDPVLKKQSR